MRFPDRFKSFFLGYTYLICTLELYLGRGTKTRLRRKVDDGEM